jgi:UDP-2,3-diacylglucosamine pyrophosphatase LpxH
MLSHLASYLLGHTIHQGYVWAYRGQAYLAIHGHQFDRFVFDYPVVSDIADVFYRTLQRLDVRRQRVSRYVKRTSKLWLRISHSVARGAARYGMARGVHHVFCGHTHQALHLVFGGVHYHNAGCWTDRPATFLTVGEQGVRIHERP